MQPIFLCPPVVTINGGIKYIFRMAEVLRAAGHDAVVFEQQARRPAWLNSDVPVVGQDIFRRDAAQVLVFPEDQPQPLAAFRDWPQRKVIYCQNHFYSALGVTGGDYAAFGVSHILCSSRTILDYAKQRHPAMAAHLVPYGINRDLFQPRAKQKRIAFMPRKRAIEATYIRDLFRHRYPQHRDWEWQELSNMSETDVARAMGEAEVFLSLSRLEGFGLTPLEAMAAGCVVTGFTGIGGREYATPENGFWAAEDDFPACVEAIKRAGDLASGSDAPRAAYFSACQKTLEAYTTDVFRGAVIAAWNAILAA